MRSELPSSVWDEDDTYPPRNQFESLTPSHNFPTLCIDGTYFYFDDSAVRRVATPEVAFNCAEPISCQRLPSPGVVDREFESQVGLTHVTSATQRDAEPDFRLAASAGPPRPVRRGDAFSE